MKKQIKDLTMMVCILALGVLVICFINLIEDKYNKKVGSILAADSVYTYPDSRLYDMSITDLKEIYMGDKYIVTMKGQSKSETDGSALMKKELESFRWPVESVVKIDDNIHKDYDYK